VLTAARWSAPSIASLIVNARSERGGIVAAATGAQLSLDFANAQAFTLGTEWQGKSGFAAVTFNQMPDPALPIEQVARVPQRAALGRTPGLGAVLSLNDSNGRTRILRALHLSHHDALDLVGRRRAAPGRRSPSRPLRLAQMSRADDLLTRARTALPEAAYRTGDFDAVEALLTEALRLAQAEGDRVGQADALDLLGVQLHSRTIELPRAEWPSIDHGLERDQFERALAIRRELGDRAGVAESLLHLGWVHQMLLGDGVTAMPLFREALDLAEPNGDPHVRSELHRHIGFHIAIDEGRPEAALPHFQTSLDLWRSGGEPARVIHGLVALARCESGAGRHQAALAHSQEALDLVGAGSYRPRVVNGAVEARRVVEAALPRP